MITSEVTKEQLAKWQELYTLKKDSLNPNRIKWSSVKWIF